MATKAGGARSSKPRLTRDQLLEALRTRREEYELDGVGTVLIESISVNRFAAIQSELGELSSSETNKRICLLGLVDPVLTPEDLDVLGEADMGLVGKLANRIMDIGGMDVKAAQRFLAKRKD